jgi:F-type H+-transporting ATPase subunit b
VFLALLLTGPCLLAAAAAEEAHSGSSASVAFLGKAVNALILFGGLAFLLAKMVRTFLDGRTQEIGRSMSEAAESRMNAERRLNEMRARLDRIDAELAKIREDGKQETGRSVGRIREQAAQDTERLRRLAREEIDLDARAARRELREYAADLAIALAETRLRTALKEDGQSRLIDRSIDWLGRLAHEEPDAR